MFLTLLDSTIQAEVYCVYNLAPDLSKILVTFEMRLTNALVIAGEFHNFKYKIMRFIIMGHLLFVNMVGKNVLINYSRN